MEEEEEAARLGAGGMRRRRGRREAAKKEERPELRGFQRRHCPERRRRSERVTVATAVAEIVGGARSEEPYVEKERERLSGPRFGVNYGSSWA